MNFAQGFGRANHATHTGMFKNVFGFAGFKFWVARHQNGPDPGAGQQQDHRGGVVVSHQTNAVFGLNAALQKPSYGQVGLIRTVLPCHDIALVFHHGLTTQLAKTSTEKFID